MNATSQIRIDPAESASESGALAGLDLFPVTIASLGTPAQPVERLMALQAAVARTVDLVTSLRMPALRLPLPAWLRAVPNRPDQGEPT